MPVLRAETVRMRSKDFRAASTAKVLMAEDSSTGRLNSLTPERLYKIHSQQRGWLNLSLSRLQANANLELFNQQGKLLSQSSQPGRTSETIRREVGPGTYYVRVSRQQGKTRYQLKLDQEPVQVGLANLQLPLPQAPDPIVQSVLDITNQYRAQAGLSPLRWNSVLTATALAHSQDMALNDFFGHTGSNGSSLFDRLRAAGYGYDSAGENVAAGYATPENVVQAWMQSSGHRANILNPELTELGVGFFLMEQDSGTVQSRYYWTQNFGTPA
ncbi:CAP domain-containing protein [Leptolyngbya sp. FACHB-711]|uniref:CAP domain-containing protein n=2 Tax=Leptolyngbya TaxID=47251 RepID=UPI001681DCE8|nr:CAP domain-containing protein [Leptolyngbya sp. FACHB-711]MBD2025735.1 T9SS type A sorting domain-containing protein [Leptolyngbya sp. FACHB-711]